MSRRASDAVVLYVVWLVVIVLASYLSAGGAIDTVSSLHTRGGGLRTVVLNILTPFIAGVFAGVAAVQILSRRNQFVATMRGHLRRATPWYVFIAFLALLIASGYGDPDFRLVSQLFVWPLCATIGALLADLLSSWRTARVNQRGAIV